MLLLIMGATFFTVTTITISSTQKNFHSPIDLPHQAQHQNPQYTAELAAKAVEPTVWTCGEGDRQKRGDVIDPVTNQRPFFAFVHVYKTGGTTVRKFFQQYATICNKSLALVEKCGGNDEHVDIKQCKFLDSNSVNAPQGIGKINSTILHDHYDILGGHFTFGMANDIFSNAAATASGDATSQVRHMVFLRQPMTKVVSHVLYQQTQGKRDKFDTLEETVKDIKKRVRSFRENGEYVGSLKWPQAPGVHKYLLTPEQRIKMTDNRQEQTVEEMMALKTQLAIDNLMRYNAIVGITEMVPQSIEIFEHALGQIVSSATKKQEVQDFFSHYTGKDEPKANGSSRGDISTGPVLKELEKDEEFMTTFREFVKYEELIYKTALDMHEKQYEAVKNGHFERYTWEESSDGSRASRELE